MERIPTGVKGLDALIEGGIPRSYSVAIIGDIGTGKTVLGSQILYNRATAGENVLLVTFETSENKIRDQWARFGWDFDGLKAKKQLSLMTTESNEREIAEMTGVIGKQIKENRIRAVLIDSLDMLAFMGRYQLLAWMKRIEALSDATVIYVAESGTGGENLSHTGVPEHESDGVIELRLDLKGKAEKRTIAIKKMRATKIKASECPMAFTEKGIVVINK